jgi:hypothetical protein
MTDVGVATTARKTSAWHRWIRRAFLFWAVISTAWLADSVRTRGVNEDTLRSSSLVSVVDQAETLAFLPARPDAKAALIFVCGSGISAAAYAPLLRPVADAGYPVFVVKLPYRFAPFESNRQGAVDRARRVMAARSRVSRWVIAGHSLGGALAARLAQAHAEELSAVVLIGTTHPKETDLSWLPIPVTKVYASNDGVAPRNRVLAHRSFLPQTTRWVEIVGGNHSQFGRYGQQLFDGTATIGREEQEAITRSAILDALAGTGFGIRKPES